MKSASEGTSGISLIEEGCKEASHLTKKADQKEATEKLVRMISDEALIIPLWKEPVGIMHQNYVHTMFNLRGGHPTTTGWRNIRLHAKFFR